MSKRAVRRVFGEQLQVYARDPNRIPHPTSGLRLDALPPRGGAARLRPRRTRRSSGSTPTTSRLRC